LRFPSSEKFQINYLTLSFPEKLERTFQDYYFLSSLRQVRIASLLGVLFYALFGILDAWLVPGVKLNLWFIRFAVVCPVVFLVFILSFSKFFKKFMQLAISCAVLTAGLGIIQMTLIAPYPASHTYYAGLILVFFYGYTFYKLRFVWATVTGWIIVIAYEVAAIWIDPTDIPILINNNFFFLTGNVFGMFACYSIEFYLRKNFLQSRLLNAEKKKVQNVNLKLEERVIERTAQLTDANKELEQEIAERKLAERERRYLEMQLRKSQKMEAIGTLAGGVAHDLNNILSGLVSYPELLLLDLPKDSPLRGPIQTIKKSGEKAGAVVQDLLTLARRGVSVTEVVNLNRLIDQYLESPEHQKILEYHPKVKVESHLETNLMNIIGSPFHLSKTIMNLVANAAEAMPGGGNIIVRTSNQYVDQSKKVFDTIEEGDYVTLTVADAGVGISANDIERIFEPFYTKKAMGRSGTGLGMAVVWGTVKDHSGYIDVKSKVDEGSTFTLYFPLTRKELSTETPDLPIENFRGRGESILIVDDIKEQREIATRMLVKLGYTVNSVSSGEESVKYLKENSANLLVLDMIMAPGIDGLDTYRKILEFKPGQKAILASGYSKSGRVREAMKLGAGAYVKKPYSIEKIGLAIKAELDRKDKIDTQIPLLTPYEDACDKKRAG
jgi:signal transduction histidine kinase/ActR/RegA family two-component response regulator